MPRIQGIRPGAGHVESVEDGALHVSWRLADGATMHMAINLAVEDRGALPPGRIIAAVAAGAWAEPTSRVPHSVIVTLA
jgi:hypothetical protein